jgi:hypothetical protein
MQEENNRMDKKMLVKKCYAYKDNSLSFLVQVKEGYEIIFNEEVTSLQSINEVADLFGLNDFEWVTIRS